MSDPGVGIELVLDTSAALAYAAGSIHVGETLAEVADNGAYFAVPVLCLAEAVRRGGDIRRLRLLERHPSAVVAPVLDGDWESLGAMARVVGRTDLGAALEIASEISAALMTGEAGEYWAALSDDDRDGDGDMVIIEI